MQYARLPEMLGCASRSRALEILEEELPPVWAAEYAARWPGGQLLTTTFDGPQGSGAYVKTMFDLRSGAGRAGATEDRVVAVWGISRAEPAATRDAGRMAGFIRGAWADAYAGRDRGHFFAHTMGGGMDINLFPQLASVNRGGDWRRLERYAAAHPGTFCFIRPIYDGPRWVPDRLEYGLYELPPAPGAFRYVGGGVFQN